MEEKPVVIGQAVTPDCLQTSTRARKWCFAGRVALSPINRDSFGHEAVDMGILSSHAQDSGVRKESERRVPSSAAPAGVEPALIDTQLLKIFERMQSETEASELEKKEFEADLTVKVATEKFLIFSDAYLQSDEETKYQISKRPGAPLSPLRPLYQRPPYAQEH